MKGSKLPAIQLADQLPGPIAYVLAGGASYGAVQVGQLRALARTDIRPDFVVGTSVGALNGAVVAEDPDSAADRLAALWSSVTREMVFGKISAINTQQIGPHDIMKNAAYTIMENTGTTPFTPM